MSYPEPRYYESLEFAHRRISDLAWIVLGIMLLVVACAPLQSTFKSVDAVCIAGRLSQAQADAINVAPWEAGGRRAPAKVNDRVLREECSECLKSFTLGGENRDLCRLVLEGLHR